LHPIATQILHFYFMITLKTTSNQLARNVADAIKAATPQQVKAALKRVQARRRVWPNKGK